MTPTVSNARRTAKSFGIFIDVSSSARRIVAYFPRERDRTFRYVRLSSGLDIIRKSLGWHEIATIQSTGIDKEAGLLRLTLVIFHVFE